MRAVEGLDVDQVVQRLKVVQRVDRRVAVVERVGPAPGGAQREVTVACQGVALGLEGRLAVVRVRDAQRAARRRCAAAIACSGLGDRARILAAERRWVIGAMDRDRDRLRGAGVEAPDREGVGGGVGGPKMLDQCVVDVVGPVAVGIDRIGAEPLGRS